jgi:hypothetical protein
MIFINVFPKFTEAPYTTAGFEPGTSALQADAMTAAPHRHGQSYLIFRQMFFSSYA